MLPRPYAHVPGLLVDVRSGAEWMTPNDGRFRSCVVQNGTEGLIRLSLTFVPESGTLHIFVEKPRSSGRARSTGKRAPRAQQDGGQQDAAGTAARAQGRGKARARSSARSRRSTLRPARLE